MTEPADQPAPPEDVVQYLNEHAPELDPEEVRSFLAQHAKPADEPGSHLAWAVRTLRERGEGEVGDGLSVDRVVSEIRRRHD